MLKAILFALIHKVTPFSVAPNSLAVKTTLVTQLMAGAKPSITNQTGPTSANQTSRL